MFTMVRTVRVAGAVALSAGLAAGLTVVAPTPAASAQAAGSGSAEAAGSGSAEAAGSGSAEAAAPTFRTLVAYVRGGDVYVSRGAAERRLTTGGGHSRPRWSPDGRRLAFLRGGLLWTMNADGTAKRRLSTRPAAGAAWSPDGRWIAFASAGCVGGPAVYRISTATTNPRTEVLFPASCRDQALPAVRRPAAAPTGTLAERQRPDDAVAWSPDGARIAFRGGECENVFDACLSLGTVATGGERPLAGYGGGGQEFSGFAVLPAFSRDGTKVTWTAHQVGDSAATTLPVHVVENDLATGRSRRLGAAQDREMVYESAARALLTGTHRGVSWVMVLNLATGARTAFHRGSQPTIQP